MPLSTKNPLHMYRNLLRLLKTPELPKELLQKHSLPPNLNRINNATTRFVKESFRQETAINGAAFDEYLSLLQDLKERARLYELDTGAEQVLDGKELSRRAAARAGLQLPKTLVDEGKN